jgi:hypothetical protein
MSRPAIFSEVEQFFPREICSLFEAMIASASQANAKSPVKYSECARRDARRTRREACSTNWRVKSIFTLPLQCNGQSVVWSRVADSVA